MARSREGTIRWASSRSELAGDLDLDADVVVSARERGAVVAAELADAGPKNRRVLEDWGACPPEMYSRMRPSEACATCSRRRLSFAAGLVTHR